MSPKSHFSKDHPEVRRYPGGAASAANSQRITPGGSDYLSTLPTMACPIEVTSRALMRRWALPVLRDIGVFRIHHFNKILRKNRDLTARTLSRELRELATRGLVRRTISVQDPFDLQWELTPRGEDLLPILAAMARFGVRHRAFEVFEDAKPRELEEVYPALQSELVRIATPVRKHPR
jgi:DNA-binding HxlR family transcriptional regulator